MRARWLMACLLLGTAAARADGLDPEALAALPDDATRAVASRFEHALRTDDSQAFMKLVGPRLRWLGAPLGRRVVSGRVAVEGVSRFLGLTKSKDSTGAWVPVPLEIDWNDKRPAELVLYPSSGGSVHAVMLRRASKAWKIAEVLSVDLSASEYAANLTSPIAVAVVLDDRLAEPLAQLKEAALAVVSQLDPHDLVEVRLVSDGVPISQLDLVGDGRAAKNQIAGITGEPGSGNTTLSTGPIVAAYDLARGPKVRHRHIVLVLGAKWHLKGYLSESVRGALALGVTVSVVGLDGSDWGEVTGLAVEGGGRSYGLPLAPDAVSQDIAAVRDQP